MLGSPPDESDSATLKEAMTENLFDLAGKVAVVTGASRALDNISGAPSRVSAATSRDASLRRIRILRLRLECASPQDSHSKTPMPASRARSLRVSTLFESMIQKVCLESFQRSLDLPPNQSAQNLLDKSIYHRL